MKQANYQSYALIIGQQYFKAKANEILWPDIPSSHQCISNELVHISLPEWCLGIGYGDKNSIAVPKCCLPVDKGNWQQVDWWRAIFIFSTCEIEWEIEKHQGPIHSYAYRLPNTIKNMFQQAWVNRIFLFLRRWVSHQMNIDESELFEQKPKGKIYLTHDVDYIKKTIPLRIKQSIISIVNSAKQLLTLNFQEGWKNLMRLAKFSLGLGNYWQFETIEQLERQYNVSSHWHIYGDNGKQRSFKKWLLDPGYSAANPKLKQKLIQLHEKGHVIGLHQSFLTWQCTENMANEKQFLAKQTNLPIQSCRQHWLRFSFKDTWLAQEKSGFTLDCTLGFNDKPGFRNAAALKMPVWLHAESRFSDTLYSIPMILMDSHLFDYHQLSAEGRRQAIDSLLEEVAFVGGEASIIWHQRVFHSDYNWGEEYAYILKRIVELNIQ